jgi:hypothetical protein
MSKPSASNEDRLREFIREVNVLLTQYTDMYRAEVQRLEELLFTTLPNGMYDALLIALIERKRNMLRVTHHNNKAQDNG